MFRVVTPGFEEKFIRWTDALDKANALIPSCKSLFEDIRIYYEDNLVWIYSRSHKYPQYIGPRIYDKLARLFIKEATEEEQSQNSESREN